MTPCEAPRQARIAVSLVFAVCGAAFATWAARVPAAQQRLGLSDGELAVGLFGLAAGSVAALVLAGPLVTVIGSRASVAVGATVLCGGLPLVALAPDVAWFVAALVVLGAGNSVLDVGMNAHAARVERAYGRPIFAGFHAFWNVGGLAGAGVAALASGVPLLVHFAGMAVVLIAVAYLAAGSGMLRGPDPGQGERAFALPPRWLLPLGVIAFCGFLAEGTVNDWSAVQLTGATGATPGVASLGYVVFSVTMLAVRLVADRLAGRIGVVTVGRVAAATTVLGFVVVALAPSPALGIAGFAVVGLGVAAIVPLAWSVAGRRASEAPGPAIAAVATCGYAGFLAGPVLVGGLASAVGLSVAIGLVGALVVTVFVLAGRLRVPV